MKTKLANEIPNDKKNKGVEITEEEMNSQLDNEDLNAEEFEYRKMVNITMKFGYSKPNRLKK